MGNGALAIGPKLPRPSSTLPPRLGTKLLDERPTILRRQQISQPGYSGLVWPRATARSAIGAALRWAICWGCSTPLSSELRGSIGNGRGVARQDRYIDLVGPTVRGTMEDIATAR